MSEISVRKPGFKVLHSEVLSGSEIMPDFMDAVSTHIHTVNMTSRANKKWLGSSGFDQWVFTECVEPVPAVKIVRDARVDGDVDRGIEEVLKLGYTPNWPELYEEYRGVKIWHCKAGTGILMPAIVPIWYREQEMEDLRVKFEVEFSVSKGVELSSTEIAWEALDLLVRGESDARKLGVNTFDYLNGVIGKPGYGVMSGIDAKVVSRETRIKRFEVGYRDMLIDERLMERIEFD